MTTATHPFSGAAPASGGMTAPIGPVKATFGGALRSEWTKIRSVRSTFWTLVVALVATIGVSVLVSIGTVGSKSGVQDLKTTGDPTSQTMSGFILGMLVMVVFGAMSITAEYSTGMIRTSFTAQPRRLVMLAAKATVLTVVALVVGLVSSLTSFLIGAQIFAGHDVHVALGDPNVLRAVVGGGLFMAVTALLSFGLGTALRHTAGSITAGVGLMFLLPVLQSFLPSAWRDAMTRWLPINAGGNILTTKDTEHMFSAWTGFGIFTLYAVVALAIGFWLTQRRDA
ncbi:ABC transporter permease subunit [Catenulispora yoronensis]|uniref:ABC transporter permease subunit n=1 Tax=Catenulispora yoronensis TaxID=450799 RepID=A0ABP5GJE7_9ACTN